MYEGYLGLLSVLTTKGLIQPGLCLRFPTMGLSGLALRGLGWECKTVAWCNFAGHRRPDYGGQLSMIHKFFAPHPVGGAVDLPLGGYHEHAHVTFSLCLCPQALRIVFRFCIL